MADSTVIINEKYIKNQLTTIFKESQNSVFNTEDAISNCKQLLKLQQSAYKFNVLLTFIDTFKECMEHALIVGLSNSCSLKANRIIDFVAEFIADLMQNEEIDPINMIAWKNILNHVLNNHRANYDSVRYRICQFLRKLLKLNQSAEQSLPQETYVKLQSCLIERMRDIREDVQIEAIKALSYLQDSTDRHCPVISSFVLMLKENVLAFKSQLCILDVIALNRQTLDALKPLLKSKCIEIRLKTYDLLIERVKLKYINHKTRFHLIKSLLKEKDENLMNSYFNRLVSSWLTQYDDNIFNLIQALNTNFYFYEQTEQDYLLQIVLAAFKLKEYDLEQLEKKFKQDCQLNSELNLHELDENSSFYYRALMHYFKLIDDEFLNKQIFNMNFMKIFKNIDVFIRANFVGLNDEYKNEAKDGRKKKLFILEQLFQVFFYYKEAFDQDFKESIEDRISNIISIERNFDEHLFQMLTDKWRFIETDPIQCVKKFFCLISYIEELYGGSEHIDLCTANKDTKNNAVKCCLFLVCQSLSDSTLREINELVQANLEDLVLTNICSFDPNIRLLAVRALGLCCLLSIDLALSYLLLFVEIIQNDEKDVILEAQKALFNMLLCYNIGNLDDYFKYENDCNDISSFNDLSMLIKLENEEEVIDQAIKFKFVLKKLVEQLNVLNCEIKFIACEGFAKLFLFKRINNNYELLSKLMLILFDSSLQNENNKIKACLLDFFTLYAKTRGVSAFEHILLPIVQLIINAPSDISFSRIDLKNLANYFLYLVLNNENNYKTHDVLLAKLLDQMMFELKFNNSDKFDKFMIVLLNLYNDDIENRRNGSINFKVIDKIYELSKSISESLKCKYPSKIADFKEFFDHVKEIHENFDESKSRKRKSIELNNQLNKGKNSSIKIEKANSSTKRIKK